MSDVIFCNEFLQVQRQGRYLVASCQQPHDVMSTSVIGGGFREDVLSVVNHQFCEGVGDTARGQHLQGIGHAAYHSEACRAAGVQAETTVLMSTAANMSCAAVATVEDPEDPAVSVTTIATAGVTSNATRAGDPATWRETAAVDPAVSGNDGTIVHVVHCSVPLTPGAFTKAVMMITEAKTVALQRWQVASRQSEGLATGTGTDQCALLAPQIDTGNPALTWPRQWTGAHSKLGELLARSVQQATDRALEQQNGFAPTHRRSVLVALGRFGLTEHVLREQAERQVSPEVAQLFSENLLAVVHDPLSATAAFALAHIVDVARSGLVPQETAAAALSQQAHLLACAIAQQEQLQVSADVQNHLHDQALKNQIPHLAATAILYGFANRWPRSF
jgi:adenosylcobinamide amidohydrolase